MSNPTPLVAGRPTCVRHGVVGLMVALAMVTYLDRTCISKLAPDIQRDLSLSKEQMSWVFSSFSLAYALFEVPTAWWADRAGTRSVLTRIVLWWSALTALTAGAFNYVSMLAVRFLFGAGEAGAWPCVARTFSKWVAPSQRGRVQGIFFAGAHLAAGLSPLIAYALNKYVGWRGVVIIFSVVGVVWVLAWRRWFHNTPAEHPATNLAEREFIAGGRTPATSSHEGWPYWRRLLTHRNTLPLCLGYIPNSTAFYFCITWLPTYLEEKHGFQKAELGFYAGLPLLMAIAGDLTGGTVTDWVTRRFGLRWGRSGVAGLGNLVAALALLAATQVTQREAAIWLIAFGTTATMFTLGAMWSTCQDIGGAHVGVVGAAMNTAGQIGAIGGPPLATWLLARTGEWNTPIFALGCLFVIGSACWLFVDPRDKVFE